MPVLGVNITFGCTIGIEIFVMWGVCARGTQDLSLVSLARTHFHLDGRSEDRYQIHNLLSRTMKEIRREAEPLPRERGSDSHS